MAKLGKEFSTPKTNIREIDDAVKERQAEDAARRAAALKPKQPSPDTEILKSDDGGL
ncbi:hypothetical protein BH09ACT13_BH09ACT13_10400 [soil metagenome]